MTPDAKAGAVEARKMSRQAAALARQAGLREPEASYETQAALLEALYGNASSAMQAIGAALRISNSRQVESAVAFAQAISGDSSRPQALSDDLSGRFPESTIVAFTYKPMLGALRALGDDEPSKALELLHIAIPYELGAGGLSLPTCVARPIWPHTQGQEEVIEFQKILRSPWHRAQRPDRRIDYGNFESATRL